MIFQTILVLNSLPTEAVPPEEILMGSEDTLWGDDDITFED